MLVRLFLISLLTSIRLSNQVSSVFCKCIILLFLLLLRLVLWKNFVFLSSRESQFVLDFNSDNSSSYLRRLLYVS